MLKDFEEFHDTKVIFADDFNLIFKINLDSLREVPFSKNLICVKFGNYVIPIKSYLHSDKIISLVLYNKGLIIFLFLTFYKNQLKKNKNSLSFDHFPIFCSVVNSDTFVCESGFCKFKNSLLFNTEFVKKLMNLQEKSSFLDYSKWEFLKYEICKFSFLSQQI